ncbi:Folylpolyglutamate synthase [Lecanosticta acicola]|uniref:tetrahydrofolate synthase n=1 Tax=Lecanosticta acicola TaxID=111012 RepID=A0AAI8Z1B5_9PEZI|nr:Folylpolyglutamate synthase [Lecanosticta acicola]
MRITPARLRVSVAFPFGCGRDMPSTLPHNAVQRDYQEDDINRLNIVHVAGTKGKGSTCAFTESLLRVHGRRTGFPSKTGLYTSPHLINPEERIRINTEPISQNTLAKYFFEVYDHLTQLAEEFDPSKEIVHRGPGYLQLWALLAFHVFIREQVDVAILETHCGGQYDATNIVQKPIVTAISTLGMDHIDMLGPTIENIAWHKAGIFKLGAHALSSPQEATAARMLEERSAAVHQPVRFIDPRPLGLKPQIQNTNASLAIEASNAYLQTCAPDPASALTEEDVVTGLSHLSWPGRFQTIHDPQKDHCTWYLDSAHNDMSVKLAAEWFAAETEAVEATRILIFSHINELRSASALLRTLGEALKTNGALVDHVILSTYDESSAASGATTTDSIQDSHKLLQVVWGAILPDSKVWSEPTIQGAIARGRELGNGDPNGMQTLITGSQHLVGPALRILERQPTIP